MTNFTHEIFAVEMDNQGDIEAYETYAQALIDVANSDENSENRFHFNDDETVETAEDAASFLKEALSLRKLHIFPTLEELKSFASKNKWCEWAVEQAFSDQ